MRDRKYKFWDKHNKVWVGPYTLRQLADEDAFSSDREWQPICSKWECFECVEYIGLKDKKKQEMYEGDIVHVEDVSLVVVEYRCAGFVVNFDNFSFSLNNFGHELLEVVGNIYENPELIK